MRWFAMHRVGFIIVVVAVVVSGARCKVTIDDLAPVPCPSDGECPSGFYCIDTSDGILDSSDECVDSCIGSGCECAKDGTCLRDTTTNADFACVPPPPSALSSKPSCDDDCVRVGEGTATLLLCRVPRSWEESRIDCEARGMRLPVINDTARATELAQSVAVTAAPIAEWWIGLTDAANEGVFLWIDGSSPSFTNFGDGEPNNSLVVDADGEDCATIRGDTGFWNDLSCNNRISHICENVP